MAHRLLDCLKNVASVSDTDVMLAGIVLRRIEEGRALTADRSALRHFIVLVHTGRREQESIRAIAALTRRGGHLLRVPLKMLHAPSFSPPVGDRRRTRRTL